MTEIWDDTPRVVMICELAYMFCILNNAWQILAFRFRFGARPLPLGKELVL
jgi:hypothetical protein